MCTGRGGGRVAHRRSLSLTDPLPTGYAEEDHPFLGAYTNAVNTKQGDTLFKYVVSIYVYEKNSVEKNKIVIFIHSFTTYIYLLFIYIILYFSITHCSCDFDKIGGL